MVSGEPSRTALAAAMHRAAHQVVERGMIFQDPLALRILGVDEETVVREAGGEARRRMRMFIAMRTRFAEDALRVAVEDGTTQLVVLGAGLDTFAYRSPYGVRLKVFEVDHPATQAWKKQRLKEAGIEVPEWLRFAPVDFERETLTEGLRAAGINDEAATFFTWLGVVPYLSETAIFETLGFIARLKGGAQVVFDYSDPPEVMDDETRAFHDQRARRVADIGERWMTYFEAEPLRERLLDVGFLEVEDLRPGQMLDRYFPGRGKQLPRRGGHLLRTWTR
jgi:methyltransferase (TIGR00027 family)